MGGVTEGSEDCGQGPMTSPQGVLILAPEAWLSGEATGCKEIGRFLEPVSCSWLAV